MKRNAIRCLAMLCAAMLPLFAQAGPVDVNSADAATISTELQGVGMIKARAIVEWRKANGPFGSADDLVKVKGIGARTVEINRKNIHLGTQGEDKR